MFYRLAEAPRTGTPAVYDRTSSSITTLAGAPALWEQMEPGSLIMERKMLLGITQRAERLAAEPREPTHV